MPSPEGSHFTAGQTPACKVHVFAKSCSYRNVWAAGGKMVLLWEPHKHALLLIIPHLVHALESTRGFPPHHYLTQSSQGPCASESVCETYATHLGIAPTLFKALLHSSQWVFLTPSGDRNDRNYQRKKTRNREGKCRHRSHRAIGTSWPQTETRAPFNTCSAPLT